MVDELPFESARRYAATLHEVSDPASGTGDRLLLVKGAPERVLDLAAPEHSATAERLREAADRLAAEGMRVLAVARAGSRTAC